MTLCQRSPGLRGHDNEYADTGNDRPYSDAEKNWQKINWCILDNFYLKAIHLKKELLGSNGQD